jgi:Cu/Ag efflux pump CusA
MLPSQFAIEKKVISWMLVVIFGAGGMMAFFSLGQLEDPPFTIKEAKILVGYPGASAQQVEEEVTYPRKLHPGSKKPTAVHNSSRNGTTCAAGYVTWSLGVNCHPERVNR